MSTRAKALKGLVSVVVPVEPGGTASACLKALQSLPKVEKQLIREVFVAQGQHPSRQRNLAVAGAKAPWILFLDSDSRLQPGSLSALLEAGEDLGATVVGGPNLPLVDEPFWGRVFQRVIGSWLGSMSSRARYAQVGARRLASEKELILCNLLARREAFVNVGGFREDLYPNEENELFNRLQAQGSLLAYEPKATVLRPRRHSIGAFAVQAFRYGRGRTQQMRANFFVSDLVNLLPLVLFLFWALCLHWPGLFYGAALGTWFGMCFMALSDRSMPGKHERIAYLPMLILRHQAYAFGLVVGAFQGTPARPVEVQLDVVRLSEA